jgi:arabinose-5-phosphate isomerase
MREANMGSLPEKQLDPALIRQLGNEVTAAEIAGIQGLETLFASPAFFQAVELLYRCRGRILIFGLGKSGLAGQRIAASLRSTGSPSIFIHPVEALHGDLGIVSPEDVAILISKSGGNAELSDLIPTFRRIGVSIIAITASADSELGRAVDLSLSIGPVTEIAPLQEVPTVSTTLFQVIGDALTVILCRLKGFTSADFAFLHPGGVLGRQVSMRVKDVMHQGADLPIIKEDTPLSTALVEIMSKRIGMTTVVDEAGRLSGIVADGDFKRILHEQGGSIRDLKTREVMTRSPRVIDADALLVVALKEMETNAGGAITSLVVTDDSDHPIGVVHIHDCLQRSAARR